MSASNRIALAILLSTVAVGCGDDESTPANGGSGGTSPTTSPVSASSTGGAGCTPGEEVPCYSGPPETAGVGVCVAGTAVCGADGMPDAETCVGEVVPTTDHCRTPADEDCDGELTECTGDHLWSKRFGDGAGQNGLGVAVDTDGNTLLYGSFDGTLDLGGPPLIGGGVFVAKLDADGNTSGARCSRRARSRHHRERSPPIATTICF